LKGGFMGTRGACGFIVDGVEKITYNHFDSYPSALGNNVLKFLSGRNLEELKKAVRKIQMIDPNSIPTQEQIQACKKYTDLNVSERPEPDWYCLVREAQGDLKAYVEDLSMMIDNKNFLKDSLFCEWAYIINLDVGKLEVYKGFNKDPNAAGRYAMSFKVGEYRGVVLIKEYDLSSVVSFSPMDIGIAISEMENG
jgi:hypothetical protein